MFSVVLDGSGFEGPELDVDHLETSGVIAGSLKFLKLLIAEGL